MSASAQSEPDTRASNGAETSRFLATFFAGLRYEALSDAIVRCAEALFLDWLVSVLAGRSAHPITILDRVAVKMGQRTARAGCWARAVTHPRSSPRWSMAPLRMWLTRTTYTMRRFSIPAQWSGWRRSPPR